MPRGSLSFVQVGLPIFGLVIGGSLTISHFLQGKYDIKEANKRAMELSKAPAGRQSESLEDALAELRRRVDLDNYENKPVPR